MDRLKWIEVKPDVGREFYRGYTGKIPVISIYILNNKYIVKSSLTFYDIKWQCESLDDAVSTANRIFSEWLKLANLEEAKNG